ncbi:MAG: methyltransferase domain-containing protein [Caldilineaceae bacterium]|nr:methyltransferase domain-containing protein [Caldilineaceae bacterium]
MLLPNFDAFAPFYDQDYRNYDDDIQLVVDLAQDAGETALELGCGTGRVLIPLAATGCRVTGVDNSPALLALARRKAEQAGVTARLQLTEADLRSFAAAETGFDFAFCVSNTLMHLNTQADQLAALHTAHRHLRPGGRLLIDLFNPDIPHLTAISGVQMLADRWEDEERGATVLKWVVRRMDVARQLQETTFIYESVYADGRTERAVLPFLLRFLWPSEGVLLLEKVGFRVDKLWGDCDGNDYASESEHLIFLATKR